MKEWSKSSRCASDVVRCREVFSSWSSSSSSETTFTAWLALEVSGTNSLIASSQACYRQSIKSVFIWPIDVVRSVISSSSRSWTRRLSNPSSISLSLVMLLTGSCPNPHFWKQSIIVFVDTGSTLLICQQSLKNYKEFLTSDCLILCKKMKSTTNSRILYSCSYKYPKLLN